MKGIIISLFPLYVLAQQEVDLQGRWQLKNDSTFELRISSDTVVLINEGRDSEFKFIIDVSPLADGAFEDVALDYFITLFQEDATLTFEILELQKSNMIWLRLPEHDRWEFIRK